MLKRIILFLWVLFGLVSCASLPPGFEAPVMSFQGFQAVSSGGVTPDFVIRVKVLNPNREALHINGLFYSASLAGEQLLAGVKSDLPVIAGYGEEILEVRAGVDVLGGIRLISELIQRPRDEFAYTLQLKLDVEGLRRPLRLSQDGALKLGTGAR